MWTRDWEICMQESQIWFHNALCRVDVKISDAQVNRREGLFWAFESKPVSAVLKMIFPMECPTKLSLIVLKTPDLEALSIFFFTKDTTSFASLWPISLKSPDVLSSLTSDIRNSAFGSIKSHWFRTSRKSRWWPCTYNETLQLKVPTITYRL